MLNRYDGPRLDPDAVKENPLLHHICEVCGKDEWLTSEEGFKQGWDYPPRMGMYGVISPRTCGSCSMGDTVWFEVVVNKKKLDELSDHQKEVVMRIVCEPESIMPYPDPTRPDPKGQKWTKTTALN